MRKKKETHIKLKKSIKRSIKNSKKRGIKIIQKFIRNSKYIAKWSNPVGINSSVLAMGEQITNVQIIENTQKLEILGKYDKIYQNFLSINNGLNVFNHTEILENFNKDLTNKEITDKIETVSNEMKEKTTNFNEVSNIPNLVGNFTKNEKSHKNSELPSNPLIENSKEYSESKNSKVKYNIIIA